jgi:hypothetical protein
MTGKGYWLRDPDEELRDALSHISAEFVAAIVETKVDDEPEAQPSAEAQS